MREWLLKDELEKRKVGRPKLALEETIKKAKKLLVFCVILILFLSFSFLSILKNENPLKSIYKISLEKYFGAIQNKEGFIIKEHYDKESNYVMEFTPSNKVKSYGGKYKYILYKLSNNSWKEVEKKDNLNDSFKVKVESKKNENTTWKIKLQIINGSKIDGSYAPANWIYVKGKDNSSMYSYKVFTVKGYYSPVSYKEIKEAKDSKDKVYVETKKNNPREFIINLPGTYKVDVSYTDEEKKTVKLIDNKEIYQKTKVTVPDMKSVSKVTIKVYNAEEKKLDIWKASEDDKYIYNTYILRKTN